MPHTPAVVRSSSQPIPSMAVNAGQRGVNGLRVLYYEASHGPRPEPAFNVRMWAADASLFPLPGAASGAKSEHARAR